MPYRTWNEMPTDVRTYLEETLGMEPMPGEGKTLKEEQEEMQEALAEKLKFTVPTDPGHTHSVSDPGHGTQSDIKEIQDLAGSIAHFKTKEMELAFARLIEACITPSMMGKDLK